MEASKERRREPWNRTARASRTCCAATGTRRPRPRSTTSSELVVDHARARLTALLRAEDEAEAQAEADAEAEDFRRLYEETFIQSSVLPHFAALGSLLAQRLLARKFPEGWGSGSAPED